MLQPIDTVVFTQQFNAHKAQVTAIISRYIKNADNVEDVLQMTFIKAWVGRASFKGDSAYSTWLITIAIRTSLTYLASQKRHAGYRYGAVTQIEAYMKPGDASECFLPPDVLLRNSCDFERICEHIKELPEHVYVVAVLSFIYELTYQEIAVAVGIPLGTVRSRLNKARNILKAKLAPDEHS